MPELATHPLREGPRQVNAKTEASHCRLRRHERLAEPRLHGGWQSMSFVEDVECDSVVHVIRKRTGATIPASR